MLDAEQRILYARQRALVAIGDAGQEALLASSLGAPLSDPRAEAVRRDYLLRAGVPDAPTGADVGGTATPPRHAADGPTAAALAGDPRLLPPAELLLGAFAAVERVKAVVGFGQPASLVNVPPLAEPL